ncbi:hypothetical protein JAAARDRAFT_38270 [Jaapia argillacea MUCL 33604]|uniref:Uncharacterized protein n=1 Tax=Jaapia argillacea MUCL 33604 TaxID=933084 RepID=A0A067PW54_9AGAM|nr:hypothetical protein JAAARDRAFT_38270 [Jaapia argillacea MUCL 33604]
MNIFNLLPSNWWQPIVSKSAETLTVNKNSNFIGWVPPVAKVVTESGTAAYIAFTTEQVRDMAEKEAMQAFEVSRIQVCERPLEGDTGLLEHLTKIGYAFVNDTYRIVPRVNHKFLVFTLNNPFPLVTGTGVTIHRRIIAERMDTGFLMGLLDDNDSRLKDVDGYEEGVPISKPITLQDVARAMISHEVCFPDYHTRIFNCWFFCVGMLHLLTTLDIRGYLPVVKVTKRGFWKRYAGPILPPAVKLVFECVFAISLDSSDDPLSTNLGPLYDLLPQAHPNDPRDQILRRILAFELCFEKLAYYYTHHQFPNPGEVFLDSEQALLDDS